MAEIRDRGVLQDVKCDRKDGLNFVEVYPRQILRLGGIPSRFPRLQINLSQRNHRVWEEGV